MNHKSYKVTFEVQVYAVSPQDAVQQAYTMVRDHGGDATAEEILCVEFRDQQLVDHSKG